MRMLAKIRRLWDHIQWADRRILDALLDGLDREDGGTADSEIKAARRPGKVTPDVVREFAHVIGAEETWLARLEGRTPRVPVWPEVSLPELEHLVKSTHESFNAYIAALEDADLARAATYTNSAGREFTSEVGDILLHVALHGQYHRGKINLMLRQRGCAPAPTDYIAFVRGAPAARTA